METRMETLWYQLSQVHLEKLVIKPERDCMWELVKALVYCLLQSKTYDSVTDKFMDFSFEKVSYWPSFFFPSILRWSVAVTTMCHQSSWIAAFLQADARPMFCWPRSAFTARSQVWLGLPNCHFQSGGSLRITAATARWWFSCGELWAICSKSRRRLSVTRWERGRHLVVAVTSTFVIWRVYGVLRILRSALQLNYPLLWE